MKHLWLLSFSLSCIALMPTEQRAAVGTLPLVSSTSRGFPLRASAQALHTAMTSRWGALSPRGRTVLKITGGTLIGAALFVGAFRTAIHTAIHYGGFNQMNGSSSGGTTGKLPVREIVSSDPFTKHTREPRLQSMTDDVEHEITITFDIGQQPLTSFWKQQEVEALSKVLANFFGNKGLPSKTSGVLDKVDDNLKHIVLRAMTLETKPNIDLTCIPQIDSALENTSQVTFVLTPGRWELNNASTGITIVQRFTVMPLLTMPNNNPIPLRLKEAETAPAVYTYRIHIAGKQSDRELARIQTTMKGLQEDLAQTVRTSGMTFVHDNVRGVKSIALCLKDGAPLSTHSKVLEAAQ